MVPTDQLVRAYTMLQQFLVPMAPLPLMVVGPQKRKVRRDREHENHA